MRLPNAARAAIDIEKLRDYALNPEHPRGRHKARVFAAALGLTAVDSEELRDALFVAGPGHIRALVPPSCQGSRRFTFAHTSH